MTDLLKAEVKADYEKNIPLSRFGNEVKLRNAVAFLLAIAHHI